jgi:phospholipase A1
MSKGIARRALAAVALAAGASVAAPPLRAADPAELQRCAAILDDRLRLACYDAAVQSASTARPQPSPLLERPPAERQVSLIEERWAVGVSGRDSRFDLRPHKPSYFVPARYSNSPNRQPDSPAKEPVGEALDLQRIEAKFQLSFKVKLADFSEFGRAGLWAGYTQQSHWQVFNGDVSRPFRESDYEPELMLALHPDYAAFGWRWRLLVIGLSHQSNGREEPLSRSWNRLYAQFGVESGDFAFLVRPWWRIPESRREDDNPDINRYFGYGDVVGVYKLGEHSLSALARFNVVSGRGALQLGWQFPIARRVRGYLQAFTGYGESLIDYNVRQNTIGVGISLADFL